jgi:CubicO group peptidase (beta-lactamase class C family)
VADIASGTPVTEDTVFRIGSITKTFTAIAVRQLWEQGLVDLDAPADDYLRSFRLVRAKESFPPATVRHLLSHTAGIGEVLHPLRPAPAAVRGDRDGGTAGTVAGRVLPGWSAHPRRAGTRWRYTDHGFARLGQIVILPSLLASGLSQTSVGPDTGEG